jgi:hypothetical protein
LLKLYLNRLSFGSIKRVQKAKKESMPTSRIELRASLDRAIMTL